MPALAALAAVVAADLGFLAVVASTAVGRRRDARDDRRAASGVLAPVSPGDRAPLARAARGRRAARAHARRQRALLPRRHVHPVAVPAVRGGRPLHAGLPGLRAARPSPRHRDDLGLPAALAPPPPAAATWRRAWSTPRPTCSSRSPRRSPPAGWCSRPELVRLLAGDDFARRGHPLRLLLCAAGAAWLSGLLGYTLIAAGRQREPAAAERRRAGGQPRAQPRARAGLGPDAAAAVAVGSEALLLARRLAARTPGPRADADGSACCGAHVVAAAAMAARPASGCAT